MKKKLVFTTLFTLMLALGIYFSASYFFVGTNNFLYVKQLISDDNRLAIKKIIFPYKLISQQHDTINQVDYLSLELDKKENSSDIGIKESVIKLSDNVTLKKYKLTSGFYAGIHEVFPGSGYIDFKEDNIIIISSRGVLAFRKKINDDKENFKQIKNNINEFIGLNQFNKNKWFSLKDLLVSNDKIFVSYTEEINENCWNTSIIYGDMNYENIKFRKLFSPNECVHSKNNIDGEFNAHQSGGKIISFDANHILFSIGDYRSRYLAQDKQSVNGKVIKINIDNNGYETFSMGHRNPQGLYFDKENNFILSTEHGPRGGDEINLIEVNNINNDEIQNYGWAISSAGEHYGGKSKKNEEIYKKYPLYKSHKDHGFIEPIKSFVPSIGISEITKINNNRYVVSSLRNETLYFFSLTNERKVVDIEKVEIKERIRDLKYYDNKLYLFLENTASIGVIPLTFSNQFQ
jgi:hypothetical protein